MKMLDGKQQIMYLDNLKTNIGVLVKDPEGKYATAMTGLKVMNVNPLISVYDASIVANVSIEVFRSSASKEANFSMELHSIEGTELLFNMSFDGTSSTSICSEKKEIYFSLSKDWIFIVNSTELPSSSWFIYKIILEFSNGQEMILLSDKFYDSEVNIAYWDVNLNQYFYDQGNYNPLFPITFDFQVYDPSIDDINVSVDYQANLLLIINCSNSLPLSENFTINGADHSVIIFSQNGFTYANITISKQVFSRFYEDNKFPCYIEEQFVLNPIIDLYAILEDEMGLGNLSILYCCYALSILEATATDDDGGQGIVEVSFDTEDDINIHNLAPRITAFIPANASVSSTITFHCQVSDFDQVSAYSNSTVVNYRSQDIPSIPEDFNIITGSSDWDGDVYFKDGDLLEFSSAVAGSNNVVNMTILFSFNNVQEWDVVKYLKIFYSTRVNFNGLKVNYSLYNFFNETFDLIHSGLESSSISSNRLSVLSPVYYNSSFN